MFGCVYITMVGMSMSVWRDKCVCMYPNVYMKVRMSEHIEMYVRICECVYKYRGVCMSVCENM